MPLSRTGGRASGRAVGVTEEHDARFSYRRASVDSLLGGGGPPNSRRLAAPAIVARACA